MKRGTPPALCLINLFHMIMEHDRQCLIILFLVFTQTGADGRQVLMLTIVSLLAIYGKLSLECCNC